MKIYVDSANTEKIRAVKELGILSGITTNPVILSREQGSALQVVERLCKTFPGMQVFAQVFADTAEGMIAQARTLAALGSDVVVKIPACREGICALAALKSDTSFTNRICATTILTAAQAVLCAAAGADYVAPYIGDVDGVGYCGESVLRDIVEALRATDTQVLAAAMNRAQEIVDAAKLGVQNITIAPEGITDVFEKVGPLSTWYLRLFQGAAREQERK